MHSILLLSLCFLAGTHSYNLFVGDIPVDPHILYEEDVVEKPLIYDVITRTISFPKPGQAPMGVITSISVKDNDRDGTGGYPSIKSGGVGKTFVKIQLKSQFNQGLNFTIKINGMALLSQQ